MTSAAQNSPITTFAGLVEEMHRIQMVMVPIESTGTNGVECRAFFAPLAGADSLVMSPVLEGLLNPVLPPTPDGVSLFSVDGRKAYVNHTVDVSTLPMDKIFRSIDRPRLAIKTNEVLTTLLEDPTPYPEIAALMAAATTAGPLDLDTLVSAIIQVSTARSCDRTAFPSFAALIGNNPTTNPDPEIFIRASYVLVFEGDSHTPLVLDSGWVVRPLLLARLSVWLNWSKPVDNRIVYDAVYTQTRLSRPTRPLLHLYLHEFPNADVLDEYDCLLINLHRFYDSRRASDGRLHFVAKPNAVFSSGLVALMHRNGFLQPAWLDGRTDALVFSCSFDVRSADLPNGNLDAELRVRDNHWAHVHAANEHMDFLRPRHLRQLQLERDELLRQAAATSTSAAPAHGDAPEEEEEVQSGQATLVRAAEEVHRDGETKSAVAVLEVEEEQPQPPPQPQQEEQETGVSDLVRESVAKVEEVGQRWLEELTQLLTSSILTKTVTGCGLDNAKVRKYFEAIIDAHEENCSDLVKRLQERYLAPLRKLVCSDKAGEVEELRMAKEDDLLAACPEEKCRLTLAKSWISRMRIASNALYANLSHAAKIVQTAHRLTADQQRLGAFCMLLNRHIEQVCSAAHHTKLAGEKITDAAYCRLIKASTQKNKQEDRPLSPSVGSVSTPEVQHAPVPAPLSKSPASEQRRPAAVRVQTPTPSAQAAASRRSQKAAVSKSATKTGTALATGQKPAWR